jgi:hypothetical protein
METSKNILICPLEWGMGHAGRMVPLALRLQELGNNVFFGSGEEHLTFLKNEVPGAKYILFPGFRIRYSSWLPQYLIILFKSPLLLYHISLEHFRLKKIIREYSIDIVISDSRIGLWNRTIKTVFVTHQLRIPFPKTFRFLEFIGIYFIRSVIRKYTWCFVPDLDGEVNVSGRLSHGILLPENVIYTGLLSRFRNVDFTPGTSSGRIVVMLSGPEPQKSILKTRITMFLLSKGTEAIILEGKPGATVESGRLKNIVFRSHLSSSETIKQLKESESIISRSGYTTVMELVNLGLTALLIPTPGQTEQEYLAESLSAKGWFRTVSQKELNREIALPLSHKSSAPNVAGMSNALLERALAKLLK